MATTTPNFGWPVPTSTDLVKDGATAMEALGDAIDTSMVDLKGGTTGQVLAKASNTDMDFSWVAQDDSNAIQNTIVDAKGDLIAASAADTPARLAVGNNGETLVADSSTATGLRYTAGNPIPNPVINSAMQIWQRGTSVAVSGSAALTFAADRWGFFRTGFATGMTVSRQATGDTTNLPFIQYSQRVQRNSGNTSTALTYSGQNFETVNSIPYAGKTVTFSFYARAGANYSAASSALNVLFITGTGTDENFLNGFTGNASPINTTATLTTTWQRFTYTATLGATVTQIAPVLYYTPVGTAGANDWFEFTGVQLDIGSVALPFRTNGATIQGELAACQRYYIRYSGGSTSGANYQVSGTALSSTTVDSYFQLPVTLRSAPTSLDYTNVGIYRVNNSTIYSGGTWSLENSSNGNTVSARYNHGSAVFTQGTDSTIMVTASNATSYVGFNAEL